MTADERRDDKVGIRINELKAPEDGSRSAILAPGLIAADRQSLAGRRSQQLESGDVVKTLRGQLADSDNTRFRAQQVETKSGTLLTSRVEYEGNGASIKVNSNDGVKELTGIKTIETVRTEDGYRTTFTDKNGKQWLADSTRAGETQRLVEKPDQAPRSAEPPGGREADPDKMRAAATTRRGEGFWQSAERLLGRGAATEQVRELTKVFQDRYKAEHPEDPNGRSLHVNHQHLTTDNLKDVIKQLSPETAARLEASISKSPPAAREGTREDAGKTSEKFRHTFGVDQRLVKREFEGGSTKAVAPEGGTEKRENAHERPSDNTKVERLTEETLKAKARDLYDAIHHKDHFWSSTGDYQGARNILGPITHLEDITRLKEYYGKLPEVKGDKTTLERDIKSAGFAEHEKISLQGQLDRKGETTNVAAELQAALVLSKSDQTKGSAQLRAILEISNSETIKKLGLDKVVEGNTGSLDKQTQEALPILLRGVDNWQTDSRAISDLARIGAQHGDRRIFAEALRTDTPAAAQARSELMKDEAFKELLAIRFPSASKDDWRRRDGQSDWNNDLRQRQPAEQRIERAALDYLKDGRISITTITDKNMNTGWLFQNKDNVELAARNAPEQERRNYIRGAELYRSPEKATTAEDKAALEFYKGAREFFQEKFGNVGWLSVDDQMRHGRPTIISELVKQHVGTYRDYHSTEALMNRAENLSAADHALLRSQQGAQFRREISETVNAITEKSDSATQKREREGVMDLIDRKAKVEKYDDAKEMRRSLANTIRDNTHTFSYNAAPILHNLAHLTPADAKAIKENKDGLGDTVRSFVNGWSLNTFQRTWGERMLAQVSETGQPHKADSIDALLQAKAEGQKPSDVLAKAEAALKEHPELKATFEKPVGQLHPQEQAIWSAVYSSMLTNPRLDRRSHSMDVQKETTAFLTTGQLSPLQKLKYGYSKEQVIGAAATGTEAERKAVTPFLSAEQKQVLEVVSKREDKTLMLADRLRLFNIDGDKDYQRFAGELSKLDSVGLQKLRGDYAHDYGHDLDKEFLAKVDNNDLPQYRELISPRQTDGKQSFIDRMEASYKASTGFAADGSSLTLDRARDQFVNTLAAYERISQQLPAEKRAALDAFLSEAIGQRQHSKERLGEIATTAVITAAAIAAAPLTEGTSLALVLPLAFAGGAVTKPFISRMIQGEDFELSSRSLIKSSLTGGVDATLNFIGVEAFKGAGLLATRAAETLAKRALTATGETVLKDGGAVALEKSLAPVVLRLGTTAEKEVLQKEIAAAVRQSLPAASKETRLQVVQAITSDFASVVAKEQAVQAALISERTLAQIVKSYGRNVAENFALGAGASIVSEKVGELASGEGIESVNWTNAGIGGTVAASLSAALHLRGLFKDVRAHTGADASSTTRGHAVGSQPGDTAAAAELAQEVAAHLKSAGFERVEERLVGGNKLELYRHTQEGVALGTINGKPYRLIDKYGRTSLFEYGADGQLNKITRSDGSFFERTQSPSSQPLFRKVGDANGDNLYEFHGVNDKGELDLRKANVSEQAAEQQVTQPGTQPRFRPGEAAAAPAERSVHSNAQAPIDLIQLPPLSPKAIARLQELPADALKVHGASAEEVAAVRHAMASLPNSLFDLVKSGEIKVEIFGSIHDRYPNANWLHQQPSGYRPGETYEHVPAQFDPATKSIHFFENHKQMAGEGANAGHTNGRLSKADIDHALNHELGHALDDKFSEATSREFHRAVIQDYAELSKDLAAGRLSTKEAEAAAYQLAKTGYVLQRIGLEGVGRHRHTDLGNGSYYGAHLRARREVFADVVSALRGTKKESYEFLKLFPRSAEYIRTKYPDLFSTGSHSLDAVTEDSLAGMGFRLRSVASPNETYFKNGATDGALYVRDGKVFELTYATDKVWDQSGNFKWRPRAEVRFYYGKSGELGFLRTEEPGINPRDWHVTEYKRILFDGREQWKITHPDGRVELAQDLKVTIDHNARPSIELVNAVAWGRARAWGWKKLSR
jgi:hypothetical protein